MAEALDQLRTVLRDSLCHEDTIKFITGAQSENDKFLELQPIDDFFHFVVAANYETEWKTHSDTCDLTQQDARQLSRIRAAWVTAKKMIESRELALAPGSSNTDDLEAPLSSSITATLDAKWASRYSHIEWVVHVAAADTLLARLWLERERRYAAYCTKRCPVISVASSSAKRS